MQLLLIGHSSHASYIAHSQSDMKCQQAYKCALQGELEVTTEAGTGKAKEPNAAGQLQDVVDRVPFLFLGLDLPPAPLYKDVMETNIIPQVAGCPFDTLPMNTRHCHTNTATPSKATRKLVHTRRRCSLQKTHQPCESCSSCSWRCR